MKILPFYICLIFLLSCNEPELLEIPGNDIVIDIPVDVVLFDNFSQIKLIDHPLRITKTRIENDSLIINVEYSGGCTKHDFKLFIGKWILKSNPPQAELYLSHNSNGDMCEAYIRREIKFDLYQLKNWFGNSMNLKGVLILRIHEPGSNEPFIPMVSYIL